MVGWRTPPIVCALFAVLFVLLAGRTVLVGEVRYDRCVKQHDACPDNICPTDCGGHVILDCRNRRVFELTWRLLYARSRYPSQS